MLTGSCGHQGYRSNGSYVGGWYGGTCGSGSPYYLLCNDCRERYLVENKATNKATEDPQLTDRNIPYSKLLQLVPDLLGSTDIHDDQGKQMISIYATVGTHHGTLDKGLYNHTGGL